ncbi:MAG TPA: hypothetical protein VGR20_13545, partial [Acidimicrobiia bacterium]|nr:hypothetical protein [Acidimicrobiia bacterium]
MTAGEPAPAGDGTAASGRRAAVTFGLGARRGGPADFGVRLDRVEELLGRPGGGGGAAAPLKLLAAVVRFQAGRAAAPAVVAAAGAVASGAELRLAAGVFPLLDLAAAVGAIAGELPVAVAHLAGTGSAAGTGSDRAPLARAGASGAAQVGLPEPLVAAGMALAAATGEEREGLVEAWLEDPAG